MLRAVCMPLTTSCMASWRADGLRICHSTHAVHSLAPNVHGDIGAGQAEGVHLSFDRRGAALGHQAAKVELYGSQAIYGSCLAQAFFNANGGFVAFKVVTIATLSQTGRGG